MAVRNCCWIRTDEISKFVYSIIVVDEADYDYLNSIWGDFYPGDYIVWQDDLVPSPGYSLPICVNWRQELPANTWYDPSTPPVFPEP